MDEKAKEILERLEAEIAALKGKLASVEAEMLSLRAAAERPVEAPETAAPVDLSDVVELPDDMPEAIAEVAEMPAEDPEIPAADAEMPADLPEETPPVPEPAAEAPVEQPEPVAPIAEAVPKRELRRLSGEYRWQKDRPGAPVKHIRSGISLYDRALFINDLFDEDFSRYDETIAALNACGTLDEAVDYLLGVFPDWDWNGEVVGAFMMAIRKKLG